MFRHASQDGNVLATCYFDCRANMSTFFERFPQNRIIHCVQCQCERVFSVWAGGLVKGGKQAWGELQQAVQRTEALTRPSEDSIPVLSTGL